MNFDRFIGIDYSGAETPTSRLKGLQVYAAQAGGSSVEPWHCPKVSNNGQRVNWTRRELAERLLQEVRQGTRFLAGIDHGFATIGPLRVTMCMWTLCVTATSFAVVTRRHPAAAREPQMSSG